MSEQEQKLEEFYEILSGDDAGDRACEAMPMKPVRKSLKTTFTTC